MQFTVFSVLFVCLVTFLINFQEAKKSSRRKTDISEPIKKRNEVRKRKFQISNKDINRAKYRKTLNKPNFKDTRRKRTKGKKVARGKSNTKRRYSKQKKRQNVKNNKAKKFRNNKNRKDRKLNKNGKKNFHKRKSRRPNRGKKAARQTSNAKRRNSKQKKRRNVRNNKTKKFRNKKNKKGRKLNKHGKKNFNKLKSKKANRGRKKIAAKVKPLLIPKLDATQVYNPNQTYPILSKQQPIIIVPAEESDNYTNTKLELIDFSTILLWRSRKRGGVSYTTDNILFRKIERCYNTHRRCIATWNGYCLRDNYKGYVLGILLGKATTLDNYPCLYWNTANYSSGLSRHNHCIKAPADISRDGDYYCHKTGNDVHKCFEHCDLEIHKKILTLEDSYNSIVLPNNKTMVFGLYNATSMEVRVDNIIAPIYRCFEHSLDCVASRPKRCVEKDFSKTAAYILTNSRNSVTGKNCMPWKNTTYSNYFQNPNENYCLEINDSGGPWCFVAKRLTWESCYPPCPENPPVSGSNCKIFELIFCAELYHGNLLALEREAKANNCNVGYDVTMC